MLMAKNEGLDNAEPHTPQSTAPTSSANGARTSSSEPSWPEHPETRAALDACSGR
jgi:hypothetical protein